MVGAMIGVLILFGVVLLIVAVACWSGRTKPYSKGSDGANGYGGSMGGGSFGGDGP